MINVTKTFLPPIEEYMSYVQKIWASGWITNNGELVRELETKLADYLGVPYVLVVSNGTVALQIALRALEIQGEVITTPFTYVATTNAILWEYCVPVFVDIDPDTLCIDPSQIEAAITERTHAILPVHVYGYPNDTEAIRTIANKRNLRVIYDAAHAFGSKMHGASLLDCGDLATLSFHATKLFHTTEGGAIVAHTEEMADKVNKLRNFGHLGDEYFMLGINGKNSEFHAAMGLAVLPHVAEIVERRKALCEIYNEEFRACKVAFSNIPEGFEHNYAYYPVLFRDEEQMLRVKRALNSHQINPRRYFYPSLNTLPFLHARQSCAVSEKMSSRVLCLPLYDSLEANDVKFIAGLVKDQL